MVGESIFLMTVIDLFAIVGFVISFGYFLKRNPNFSWKRAKRGFLVLFVGLGFIVSFFFVDLFLMHGLPLLLPAPQAMELMKNLHLNYIWLFIPPGSLFITIGLFLIITRYGINVSLLEESQEKFRLVAENANDIITLRDAKTKVIYVSPSFKKHLGRNPKNMLGTRIGPRLIHPDDRGILKDWKKTVFKEGKHFMAVVRLEAKDGKYILFESETEPIKDEYGKVTGSVTISRNFTQQKEEEDRRIQLGRVLDNSLHEIYMADLKTGQFVFANKIACKNLGYTHAELTKLSPFDINRSMKEDHEVFANAIKPVQKGEKEKNRMEGVHIRKDGSTYDVKITLQLSKFENKPVVVGIVEDITEKKEIAAQLRQAQKMEAVGQLTGGVAHDFNNLLTAMQGGIMLAQMEDISDTARDCLEISMGAVKKGADLTHRLLAFSRTQTLKPEVVDINDMVRGFEPLLKRTLGENIEIETVLMKERGLVKLDVNELENSLLNLSVNARDAMAGGGHLTIEVESRKITRSEADQKELSPGDFLILSVSDTGSGMPPEVRDRIFEPFYTTKDEGKGTGLGLSTVYGFVKQSGGHVTVYSEVGIGTTFKLYLPETDKQKFAKPKKKKVVVSHQKAAGKILLVEDNDEVRAFVAKALSTKGYAVFEVANGPDAIKLMKKISDFDLLLTDVVLPKGMDGVEVGKKFEEMFPGREIIYSSGFTAKAIEQNGFLKEGEEILSKPYDMNELFEKVGFRMQNKKA